MDKKNILVAIGAVLATILVLVVLEEVFDDGGDWEDEIEWEEVEEWVRNVEDGADGGEISLGDELLSLWEAVEAGALTDEEYEMIKGVILHEFEVLAEEIEAMEEEEEDGGDFDDDEGDGNADSRREL